MSSKDSIVRDLTSLIPGYGGYQALEARREDDRLTREFLVKRLKDAKNAIDQLGTKAIETGDLDAPMKIEKLRARIDLAQSRVSAALEGYAGWFSERTVDEKLLKQVAELDANLVSLVDQLEQIAKDQSSSNHLDLSEMTEAAELLNRRIDRRNELLRVGS